MTDGERIAELERLLAAEVESNRHTRALLVTADACQAPISQIATLTVLLKAARTQRDAMESDITEMQATIEAVRKRAEHAEHERDLYAQTMSDADRSVAAFGSALEDAQKELDTVKSLLAAANERIDKHQAERDCIVATLHNQLCRVRADRDAAKARCAEMDRERDASESRCSALSRALSGLFDVNYPHPDEGWTGYHDRLADAFLRETGIWPPGKDQPVAAGDDGRTPAERHLLFRQWEDELRRKAEVAARAALASEGRGHQGNAAFRPDAVRGKTAPAERPGNENLHEAPLPVEPDREHPGTPPPRGVQEGGIPPSPAPPSPATPSTLASRLRDFVDDIESAAKAPGNGTDYVRGRDEVTLEICHDLRLMLAPATPEGDHHE